MDALTLRDAQRPDPGGRVGLRVEGAKSVVELDECFDQMLDWSTDLAVDFAVAQLYR